MKVFWLIILISGTFGNQVDQIGPFVSFAQCDEAITRLPPISFWRGGRFKELAYICVEGIK